MSQNRQPEGTPTGGQFAADARDESAVVLNERPPMMSAGYADDEVEVWQADVAYVSQLTDRESATVGRMSFPAMKRVRDRLQTGAGPGFRATGPQQRQTICDQIGTGTVLGISGGRVVPLPDGIDLPVSGGYSVRVRLAGNDTYTVQRVFTRGGKEWVKGEKQHIYAGSVSEVAYRAGMYHSYDNDFRSED